MIIIPIVVPAGASRDSGRVPEMDRMDYPDLKAGDLVGVLRQEGSRFSLMKWTWYIYVVPKDSDVYYPGLEGKLQRYWAFHDCGFAATLWGAQRKLARAVRLYHDGIRKEIRTFPL